MAIKLVIPGPAYYRQHPRGSAFLALLLTLLLAWVSLASADSALHRALHQDGHGDSHSCLLCSLAKGHVAANPAPAEFLPTDLSVLPSTPPAPVAGAISDLRLPSGRAPPAR